MGIPDLLRGGPDRATLPRGRGFGTARATFRQRLSGVLTPESLFRLILAFVLATALWLYVTSRSAPDASFPYPQPIAIATENVGAGLTVSSILPFVHVSVQPLAGELSVPASSFVATVNLARLGAGLHKHVPVHLAADPTVSVVGYSPHSIAVVVDHVISRLVPLHIQEMNALPRGYGLGPTGITASAPAVKVIGAASFVKQVARAIVPVSLSSVRSSFTADYSPILENEQGRPIASHLAVFPGRVRIYASVEQLASYKTLPILASLHGEPAAGFGVMSIEINPPGLTAYGGRKALSSLRNLETATVEVGNLRGGKKRFSVRLVRPQHIYFHTKRVLVTVTVGPVIGAAAVRIPVRPAGLTAGDVAQIQPQTVLVTITGPAPALSAAGSHIQLLVNVAGLDDGSFTMAPSIRTPAGVHVDSMQPSHVSVTIRTG